MLLTADLKKKKHTHKKLRQQRPASKKTKQKKQCCHVVVFFVFFIPRLLATPVAMPEGPEVHLAARLVNAACAGVAFSGAPDRKGGEKKKKKFLQRHVCFPEFDLKQVEVGLALSWEIGCLKKNSIQVRGRVQEAAGGGVRQRGLQGDGGGQGEGDQGVEGGREGGRDLMTSADRCTFLFSEHHLFFFFFYMK